MTQGPYYTNKRLEKLFRSYLEGSGKESDIARNEIGFLEKLTGEQVVEALKNVESENMRLYETECNEKYNLIKEIRDNLKDNSIEYKEKLDNIEKIITKYDDFVDNPSKSSE